MIAADRHRRILSILESQGSSSTVELAHRLGVSEATIRRDLVVMDRNGQVNRVHGGALLVTETETPFEQVAADEQLGGERGRIAREAAMMVPDGSNVMLDIGTTTAAVAAALHGRRVTVITASLAVIDELADDDTVSLIALGGIYRKNYRSFVGFLTEESIRQFRADVAFIGTSGISPTGVVSDSTIVEIPMKRAMMSSADRSVLLATSDKFPGAGLTRVCDISQFDALISTVEAGAAAEAAVSGIATRLVTA